METFLINGRPFTVNNKGQKVDEDGFCTSTTTRLKVNRTKCVSVKISDDNVKVRDTKDPTKTTLTFDHAEWRAFLDGAKKGEFDLKP